MAIACAIIIIIMIIIIMFGMAISGDLLLFVVECFYRLFDMVLIRIFL